MNEPQTYITHADLAEVIVCLKQAVRESTKAALSEAMAEQLLDKMAAANLCGFKSYTTFAKLAKTPGFPLSVNGKFRRAEIERWLQMNGGAK